MPRCYPIDIQLFTQQKQHKTSTAAAIAQALTYKGKSALLIDLDAQRSASLIYGAEEDGTGGTYSLIMGTAQAEDLIQETPAGSIIPGSKDLEGLDVELSAKPGRDFFLKGAIEPIKERFDCIICDAPPGKGTALVQALTAADSVVIPLLCDPQALQGLHHVTKTIEEVKKYCNPGLTIEGILLTRYSGRAVLSREVLELMQQQAAALNTKLFKVQIREAISVKEAQISQKSLFEYAPKAKVTEDYSAFLDEIIDAGGAEDGN